TVFAVSPERPGVARGGRRSLADGAAPAARVHVRTLLAPPQSTAGDPGCAQNERIDRTLGVAVPDGGHFESRVDQRRSHVGGPMEVLPVMLAEGAAAVERNDVDSSVAGTRAGVDDASDHKPVPTRLAVNDGSGDRE